MTDDGLYNRAQLLNKEALPLVRKMQSGVGKMLRRDGLPQIQVMPSTGFCLYREFITILVVRPTRINSIVTHSIHGCGSIET